ncbi:MAG: hypothetical protein H6626_11705 [Pseudobdellovibrionaceae bacterium]|nr:hypothetical protein [Bdellovibrionales bacterium]USN46853.1 MAG: hypothetical protein H6626_11705 [Pseudobdellovibrionaceae bacterium]
MMNLSTFKNLCVSMMLLFAISLLGCKREHSNPEQLDPIYRDLTKDLRTVESTLKAERKTLDTLEAEIKKEGVSSLDRITLQKDVRRSQLKIQELEQQYRYLDIRTNRRRVEGRRNYKIAFKKGEAWPDPKEYEAYKTNMALRNASRNWNTRVPKLHQNNPNYSKVITPSETATENASH